MGTVTQTIGTSSRNFSTIALWEAALPANLVTDGNSYVGQCFNDSEFVLGATTTTFAGSTTDATHTITLTTGTGQSFRDNAGAASNPLRYDATKGVGVSSSVTYGKALVISEAFVTLQNLQVRNTGVGGNTGAIFFDVSGTDGIIDSCIGQGVSGGSAVGVVVNNARSVTKNTLAVLDSSNSGGIGLQIFSGGSAINCTVVRPTNKTTTGTGIQCQYSSSTLQNCAVAGFTTAMGGSATLSGSGNAIDTGSYPTGLTGQVSLTIATEFVQPSNASSVMDWRLNSTSVKCKDNGTNSGAPSTDIIGQAISNTTRDVGAWELQQAAAGFIAAWAMNTNIPVLGTGIY